MSIAASLRRAPLRLVTGAFILNSGVGKLTSKSEEQAQGVHGFATGTYPFLKSVPPKRFLTLLGAGETVIGAALLLPIVPAGLAGLALAGFSAGLLGLYVKTPGMHDKYFRPSEQGTPISKDIWMLGIGTGLVFDALTKEAGVLRDKIDG